MIVKNVKVLAYVRTFFYLCSIKINQIKINVMDRLEFLNQELGTNYKSLDDVNWHRISSCQKLSEKFIKEFQDKVIWDLISEFQKLSEEFIREFQVKFDWFYISKYQKFSENFIREFQDKVYWFYISKYQKLSENFIREFQDNVYWAYISIYQKLSENFIREFKDKVDWVLISECQKLSDDFIKEFDLKIDEDNWLYKSIEFKKKQIIDSGLYECHEDYFIAYKAIRNDRYSHYNFQYQYLPNKVYECHCDCTSNIDSFGLSVWTEKGARNYNNSGLIVKVKVKYEDIGRLVHNSNKIRCFKIEVLE